MNLNIRTEHPRVLVTNPGPQAQGLIHSLLSQGAAVTVEIDGPTADILDLASRGLVTIEPAPNYTEFDIIVRDRTERPGQQGRDPSPSVLGSVTLVGGGPGDIGLLTLAGLEAIRKADVVVCDRLAPLAALDHARPGAEIIHVGKIPRSAFTSQETINGILVDRALNGANVVRLKGGDSFVFGRGGEEWVACMRAGIPVAVIPGVSSAIAAPALAGIPLTHRSLTQGFIVVSGHVPPDDPGSQVDWQALATLKFTLVVLMGVATLSDISTSLIAGGMDPRTPCACIADGGMPSMRQVLSSLEDIAAAAQSAGITAPAVTVIGKAVEALHGNQ